jgi:hypothetical protein
LTETGNLFSHEDKTGAKAITEADFSKSRRFIFTGLMFTTNITNII